MKPGKRKFLQGLAASGAAAWAGLGPATVAAAARSSKIAAAAPEFDLLVIEHRGPWSDHLVMDAVPMEEVDHSPRRRSSGEARW